jgi:hypothetical protein
MIRKKYLKAWLVFVNIKPETGEPLIDLVEIEKATTNNENYI